MGRWIATLAAYSSSLAKTHFSSAGTCTDERRGGVPDFSPFYMDIDGDVDGIDFLGFDYLTRYLLQPDRDEEADDEWDGEDDPEDDYEDSETDEDEY